ncbi:hypothetical protein MTX78_02955 [Hymenobacter tibetensis]|uniref:Fibronectin type-III domain-containing protein n=1 Tax=Hymenobacter tibetensis TaxID=497967 RepID=A0ABY4CZ67_9BACT|nr:hypothetical protein [Hymenobacter tibetensis]UOG75558.1 hypothetical protein MTX78_02955 [Hymenobacter tibetensis]
MNNQQLKAPPLNAHLRFWLRVFVVQLFVQQQLLLRAEAQVANDDIKHRQVLRAEQPIKSSTTNCTVQWSAVDEKLTGKCIEYHNDQWFEFTPQVSGRYYVNVGGQQCRDTRGVQLVVLTGTPGQPDTYNILSCTSLGSQDDVFVTLDGLRAGQPYLLDVDGYLKDFCEFSLAVSRKPQGLPAVAAPLLSTVAASNNKLFTLRWSLSDTLAAVQQFRVLRREAGEFRASAQATLEVSRTTLGGSSTEYSWTDTLSTPGRYLYQVVAEASDNAAPVVVQQQWYAFSQLLPEAGYFSGIASQAAQRATKAQQSWERRSHRARMKRLAGLKRRQPKS